MKQCLASVWRKCKMRVKDGFVLHNIGEEYMAVATGEAAENFNGIVRSNETAAYIFELLQKETTEEAIVDAMCERYDADRNVIEKDVANIIEKMREAGFLHE